MEGERRNYSYSLLFFLHAVTVCKAQISWTQHSHCHCRNGKRAYYWYYIFSFAVVSSRSSTTTSPRIEPCRLVFETRSANHCTNLSYIFYTFLVWVILIENSKSNKIGQYAGIRMRTSKLRRSTYFSVHDTVIFYTNSDWPFEGIEQRLNLLYSSTALHFLPISSTQHKQKC